MAESATTLADSHIAISSRVAFVIAAATMNIAPVGIHAATTARESPGTMATAELALLRLLLLRLFRLLLLLARDMLERFAGGLDVLLAAGFIEALCLGDVLVDPFSHVVAVGERVA